MKRYEIWMADLPSQKNSHVQGGYRPVIIVSNDAANAHSPVLTVVPMTSKLTKNCLPTHVLIREQGLEKDSLALCEQIITLDTTRLIRRMGYVYRPFDRVAISHALAIQLGMTA